MKNIIQTKQKTAFFLIAILMISGIIVVGGGFYLFSKIQKPPEITGTSDTSNTQTYRDELFGFEFKYPNNLLRHDLRDSVCFEGETTNFCVKNYTVASEISIYQWVDDGYEYRHQDYYSYDKKPVSVSGYSALQLVGLEYDYLSKNFNSKSGLIVNYGTNILEILGDNIPQETLSSVTFFASSEKITPYEVEVVWNNALIKESDTGEEIQSRSCFEGESYIAGQINNGIFKGDKIVVRDRQSCGMDCGGLSENEPNYYVYHENRSVFIGKDSGYTLKGLETPDTIQIPNSNYILKKNFASGFFNKENIKSILFENNIGKVYETVYNNIVLERQDHAAIYYSIDTPFINRENGEINIILVNGAKFDESYELNPDWMGLSLASRQIDENRDLAKIGQNNNGEPFFVLKNQQDQQLIDIYNNENSIARIEGKTMPFYEEFLNDYPLLYWKDPFGRWVELKNKKYIPAVEKCKPVIYLYPQEKMDISVYVKPNGGFIKTIPEYNSGWHVTAYPNGTIINKSTKEEYPYLYWSGWNINIPSINKGWVVERKNIEKFLEEKLTILGLNKKEIADFNEYWVARLNKEGSPYYKIMFLDQEIFNRLSPLRVEGEKRPNQVIRVDMYAQPALGNEVLPPQNFSKTPTRNGFTVVEWGGSLLK